jgi:nicotinate-nucleotide pyrophosphorylase (carboxylating)
MASVTPEALEDADVADPPLAAVREAVARALAEDLAPFGDLTGSLLPISARLAGRVVARATGVVAGRLAALETFWQVDPAIAVHWLLPDGSRVEPGSVVAELEGPARSVLAAERTALNFLGRLSGIATLTRRFVDAARVANPRVEVLDTRKTTPGLRALEKAAVRAGGGRNHRGSLSDAVLVKDNHLGSMGIAAAVEAARRRWPGRFVEVECDALEQVRQAVEAGADGVLLDNMTPAAVAAAVAIARQAADRRVVVEASGGVTLESIGEIAAAGPDWISVGALTHSAPALDLGLDLASAADDACRLDDPPDG